MTALRTMVNNVEDETLTMNYRDTQQLYNRNVFKYNVDDGDDRSATSGLTSSSTTLLTVIIVLVCGSIY